MNIRDTIPSCAIQPLVLFNGMVVSLSAAGLAPRMRGILLAAWLMSAYASARAR